MSNTNYPAGCIDVGASQIKFNTAETSSNVYNPKFIQKSQSVFQDQLDACANKCGASGYTSEYVYVKKAEAIDNYQFAPPEPVSTVNEYPDLPPFKASSLRECFYLWNPTSSTISAWAERVVSFNPLNGECWKGTRNGLAWYYSLPSSSAFDKTMKCYCMSDSCPSATMHQNFTSSDWNQIYNRRVVTNATSTSKVFKVKGEHSAFELFPYKGFWDCDAVQYSNVTTTQDCSNYAKLLHHFVYSYNAEKQICIVYTHYKDDAHEQLLELGEYAEWCYKGDQLRGYDGFNLQYGTCAEDITGRDVVLHRNCDMAVKDALNGSQCLTWQVAQNTYYEVYSGAPATLDVKLGSGESSYNRKP